VKKGGLYSLDVSSVYKYKNTTVDVKLDTDSNVSDMEHLNLCIFSLWLIARHKHVTLLYDSGRSLLH
jgi:hypothetical protein